MMVFDTMASDDITLTQLQMLGSERLADLVLQECHERPQFEQRVQRALATLGDTKGLVSLVKQQLTSLSRGKKFYSASESHQFSNELSEVHQAIVNEVAPIALDAAIELTKKFLSLHRKVFERVDDSYGNIWPIFNDALEALSGFYEKDNTMDATKLAKDVLDWYDHNNYAVYDNVIKYFAPVLGLSGRNHLEQCLRQRVEASCPPAGSRDFTRERAISGLLNLADACQDIDGYIAILETYHAPVAAHHKIGVAQRLVNAHRYEEVLSWLETLEPSARYDDEKRLLTVQALEGLGQSAAAQTVRIEQFSASLSEALYEDCLEHSESPNTLREQLLGAAMVHTIKSQALSFLIRVGEFAKAAQLIRENQADWDGLSYYTLQPAAKALEKAWPLESTILYRALIEDILTRAQSKYYHHAVRYLKALEALSTQIDRWADLPSHVQYFDALQETHRRKKALWQKYSQ
jgi:hypothetical protein